MMTLWVPSYLFTLHWVLYETDASQDLGVAPHNLTMVPGGAIFTEARGGAFTTALFLFSSVINYYALFGGMHISIPPPSVLLNRNRITHGLYLYNNKMVLINMILCKVWVYKLRICPRAYIYRIKNYMSCNRE